MKQQQYNPQLHHRKSIRLKGYDYSQAGAYYITICITDKAYLLGKIANGEMLLNNAGLMLEQWWQKIPEKFPGVILGEYKIMPNHFHAIVNVGVDPCVNPVSREAGNTNEVSISCTSEINIQPNTNNNLAEHHGFALHNIVQWFKTMTTNEYIKNVKLDQWEPFNGKLFQRNYYEHIIRNEDSYYSIASYIRNNPVNWENDDFR